MKTMERLLLQLGFDEIQSKIYAEVYFTGSSTVLELASALNIKRPTVHFHVEKLLEKGVLKNGVKSGRRVLTAVPPETFVGLVEEQKSKTQLLEKSLDKMLAEMASLAGTSAGNGLSVHCENGKEAVEIILEKAFDFGDLCLYCDATRLGELQKIKENLLFDTKIRASVQSYIELLRGDEKSADYIKRASVFRGVTVKATTLKVQSDLALLLVFESKIAMVRKLSDWQLLIIDQPILADFLKTILAVN